MGDATHLALPSLPLLGAAPPHAICEAVSGSRSAPCLQMGTTLHTHNLSDKEADRWTNEMAILEASEKLALVRGYVY